MSFFDNIDSPDKAYVLGWIVSDGYVNKYKLTFCLNDLDILEKIKSIMSSKHKITESNYYDKRTNKTYTRYFLQISSIKIIKSLNNLGVYQAKSFDVSLPKISNELYPHLIRGIFDGDGYFGTSLVDDIVKPRFSLIISESMLFDINIIFSNLGITLNKTYLVAEKDTKKIVKVFIYKRKDLIIFFNYLYQDGKITKLDRKYNKVMEILFK
jgi:hypothetical protein